MTQLFAQPYDITANGFYFSSVEEYIKNAATNCNGMGFPVEEYDIQFIDGDSIDARLFKMLDIGQCNIGTFFKACDNWTEEQKRKAIIAVGECGYSFDSASGNPDDFDVDIYEVDSLRDLAIQFVEEGLFGDVSKGVIDYLDFNAIAYDLGMDYFEIIIGDVWLVYRCG